jgi:prenylcysteine oxidase/farnesylcysteine lyase
METTTISTRNVVDLLLTEQFGAGICGSGDGVLPLDKDDKEKWDAEEKVWGWDC